MTRLRAVRTAIAATLLLFLAAACAGATDDSGESAGTGAGSDGASADRDPDAVALRIELTGGFLTPTMVAARLPVVTVYGDGRVLSEGPTILSYPGPALPNVLQRRIAPAEVDGLVDRARAAGVGGPKTDYGQPSIADAPATRFIVEDDVVEVYALAEAQPDNGLTAEQVRAREELRKLQAALTDLPATLGADAVGKEEAYRPTAMAAVAAPWVDASDMKQAEVAWPGPTLPGKTIAPDTGCVTVTGEALTKLLAAAEQANAGTPWTSGGKRWQVALRPLLPDESGCADLTG